MRLLALETATREGSVALLDGGRLTEEKVELRGTGVVAALAALLERENVDPDFLDAVAVSVGPGSFTGVRVGVAAAQGLGFGSDLKLVGVGTLDALAESAVGTEWGVPGTVILASVDARRGEVYAALYRVAEGDRAPERLWGPEPVSCATLAERFATLQSPGETPGVLVGDGAALLAPLFPAEAGWAAPSRLAAARAGAVARVAVRLVKAGRTVGPEELEPVYLRKSDAEIQREERQHRD